MKILLVTASADWSTRDVADAYEAAFKDLGHELKVFRLASRLKFWDVALQAWGEETGQAVTPVQIIKEACDWVLVEAAYYQPDITFIVSGMAFHPNALALLKMHGYRSALVLTECPYNDKEHMGMAPYTDYVFANDLWSIPTLQGANPATYYMPTAYNEHGHFPQEPEGQADVLFVGTGFGERLKLLEAVDWAGIDLQLFGFFGADDKPCHLKTAEPIANAEAARRYCGAKVCLNFYRDGSGYSLNPRAYELAACGAFQLAQDSVFEAHELFGDSIAYFDDAVSLERQVRFWLAPENEERRRNMAKEAMRLVQGQSYTERAKQVAKIIEGVAAKVAARKEN